MHTIVTTRQMRSIDADSICNDSDTGYLYMQRAAEHLYTLIRSLHSPAQDVTIAIVCGKGNNGGDGYVCGCLLVDAGYTVTCFAAVPPDTLTGECARAMKDYELRKGNIRILADADTDVSFNGFTIIVDALLGTGSKGDPRGSFPRLINAVNKSGAIVIAVDTPSGLDLDTGLPGNPTVRSTYTIAMGFPKFGHYFQPGKSFTGKLSVGDLGYQEQIVNLHRGAIHIPEIADLQLLLPPRKPSGSKFDFGQALIIAGSPGMTGSATLCAEAALRSGCGMVHCAFPDSIMNILSVKLTEPILHPQGATDSGSLALGSFEPISLLMQRMQAACIGPGLTFHEATSLTVRQLVTTANNPLILDADGLNAFKNAVPLLAEHPSELVITPHRGEWERLFGTLPSSPEAVIDTVQKIATGFTMTILLKGNPTIIATPHGTTFIMPFGNTALAKAGSGDVLSGIIVSLLAMGMRSHDAALLGAYLHGTAGELASVNLGEYSVTPRDVVAHISGAFGTLANMPTR